MMFSLFRLATSFGRIAGNTQIYEQLKKNKMKKYTSEGFRIFLLINVFFHLIYSVLYGIHGDERWFSRYALVLILLAFVGISKQLEMNKNNEK